MRQYSSGSDPGMTLVEPRCKSYTVTVPVRTSYVARDRKPGSNWGLLAFITGNFKRSRGFQGWFDSYLASLFSVVLRRPLGRLGPSRDLSLRSVRCAIWGERASHSKQSPRVNPA